jgi:threonine/homoserine/homoserine lactone efflux protein
MGSTIGEILPLALGVALSPLPIVAVILMLFTNNARKTSLAFLVGWFLGITIVALAVILIANPANQATGGEESSLYAIVHIALGLLLLVAAYRDWKKRPKPGEEVAVPKWMASIDSITAGKALGMGALLSGVNPKNLALIMSAGVAIAAAGLDASQTLVVLIIFIFIACISVAAPVVVYLVMGDRATPILNSWKAWLTYNNTTVMMILLLVFGLVVLGKGISALAG